VTAVDGVSLAVQPGEIFGLLGPNGAGKTTIISIISTLLKADSGTVRIAGHDAAKEPGAVRPLIGLVPQETGIYPMLSARENLEYFAGIQGLSGGELRQRIEDALDVGGLQEYADKPHAGYFSGGMMRRLNLATGLVHHPRLLLLDEPTVGVDTQSRHLILSSIERLRKENGMAVLLTTHYMEEAETLCDRVAIVDHGRVLACDEVPRLVTSVSGTRLEVTLAEPSGEFEQALSSSDGVADVTALDDRRYVVQAANQERGLAALVAVAGRNGISFEELRILPPSLEQVYLSLTGHELRDRSSE